MCLKTSKTLIHHAILTKTGAKKGRPIKNSEQLKKSNNFSGISNYKILVFQKHLITSTVALTDDNINY
jgi:hypothetical protein